VRRRRVPYAKCYTRVPGMELPYRHWGQLTPIKLANPQKL
jgi:hypothetical protein